MKVLILLTVPPGHSYHNCTMVLDTIRVGFPTAEIEVYVNPPYEPHLRDLSQRADKAGAYIFFNFKNTTHYDWIDASRTISGDDTLVYVDGDIVFFSSVEDVVLLEPIAGMFIPSHLSDYSNSLYMSRLHTCLLYIRSPRELDSLIRYRNPRAGCNVQFEPYLIHNLISPSYEYINGKPIYYDTCSKLYHAISGQHLPEDVLDRFEHLNSASFYDAMFPLFTTEEARSGFVASHSLAETNPQGARGLRRGQEVYYAERAMSLYDYLCPPSP